MKIKKLDENDPTALYHRYPGQSEPQVSFVEIDLDEETIRADWDGDIGGGVPMFVYHGRQRRYALHPYCLPQPVNELMEELLPFAEKMAAGYSCEWDGSNHVGRLSPEAEQAEEAVRDMVENYQPDALEMLVVMDACEYYESVQSEHLTLLRDSGEKALRESISRDFYCTNAGLPVHLENIDEYVEFLRETLSEED